MKNAARFWFFIAAILTISPCFGQSCGAVQSLTPPQKNQVAILRSQLEAALVQEKLSAIDSLNNLLKAAFGPEGGKPDAVESYYNLVGATSWPNLPSTVALSRQLISSNSTTYADLWKMAKGMAPPAYQPHSIFLRTSAETAVGLLRIADKETNPARKAQYQAWANRALDSLATMQLPSGAFPFPDLRPYGDPVFSSIIKKYLTSLGADSSLVLVRGWIIDDRNSGEFKFDAGVIGNRLSVVASGLCAGQHVVSGRDQTPNQRLNWPPPQSGNDKWKVPGCSITGPLHRTAETCRIRNNYRFSPKHKIVRFSQSVYRTGECHF